MEPLGPWVSIVEVLGNNNADPLLFPLGYPLPNDEVPSPGCPLLCTSASKCSELTLIGFRLKMIASVGNYLRGVALAGGND